MAFAALACGGTAGGFVGDGLMFAALVHVAVNAGKVAAVTGFRVMPDEDGLPEWD